MPTHPIHRWHLLLSRIELGRTLRGSAQKAHALAHDLHDLRRPEDGIAESLGHRVPPPDVDQRE